MVLTSTQQKIMDYLKRNAHSDNTIRTSAYEISSYIPKGESLINKCLNELIEGEYISRSGHPQVIYEILTVYKWRLTFGTGRTFKSRNEARTYVEAKWGKFDAKNKSGRPGIVPNSSFEEELGKKIVPAVELNSAIKFIKPQKRSLEGEDPLTLAVTALEGIASYFPDTYPRYLYIEVLESMLPECKSCKRPECVNTCWAKKELTKYA